MKTMARFFSVLGILIFGLNSWALKAEMSRLFEGKCPGTNKAAFAFDPVMRWTQTGIYLEFKLALKACVDGATEFSVYNPVEKEYVELYDITGPGVPPASVSIAIPPYDAVNLYTMTDDELRAMIVNIYKSSGVDATDIVAKFDRSTLEATLKDMIPSLNKSDDELSYSQIALEIPLSSLTSLKDSGTKTLRLNVWLFGARIPYNLVFSYEGTGITAQLAAAK